MPLGGFVSFPTRIARWSNSRVDSTNTEAFRCTSKSWLQLCKDGELVTTREAPGRSANKSGKDDDDPRRIKNKCKRVIDNPWSADDQPGSADNKLGSARDNPGSADVNAGSTDEKPGSTGNKAWECQSQPWECWWQSWKHQWQLWECRRQA